MVYKLAEDFNNLEQIQIGQLWECITEEQAPSNNGSFIPKNPYVNVKDVVEILEISHPVNVAVRNLRTGKETNENRYRMSYFYRKI